MSSRKSTARLAGGLYFVTALMMIYGYMYAPAQFSGSASVTAAKIADHELLYRASTLIALVCVGITAEIVNIAAHFAPILLATDKDFQAAFTKSQLDALGDGVLVLGN